MNHSPKILIATTSRRYSAAQLAVSFARSGCIVEAVCPSQHPLGTTTSTNECYDFNPLRPKQSLCDAIELSAPDLIVPCDDLAAIHLRQVYADLAAGNVRAPHRFPDPEQAAAVMQLLQASLGDPASFAILDSRASFLQASQLEGIRTPLTAQLHSGDDVLAWCQKLGFPAVLKADGSWGSRGVKTVHSLKEALAAFYTLQSPFSMAMALKRALVDGDLNPLSPVLKRTHPAISIQQVIAGQDFNIAAACWKGEVLASIGVEVLETAYSHGPATRIRTVADRHMLVTAQQMARRLNLTGICGFDFKVEQSTGRHYLIAINARAPQTSHLSLGSDSDLSSALAGRLYGEHRRPVNATPKFETTLFPEIHAWQTA